MIVFTIDSRNRIGHPTTKTDMIGRLVRNNKAKIIKRYGQTVLVQFLKKQFDSSKTVDAEFRIGIDPGYKHIGFSVLKIYKKTITILFSGEFETRTPDITKNMLERKMYRQLRRHFRRKNVKRKFNLAKFRHPIWKNRKKKPFAPTHKHLIDSHVNLVNKIFNLIPQDQAKIHIEYAKFDIHKIINPRIHDWQYQRGIQYGFENVKSYVRSRDNYTCQICGASKDIVIQVHHIIERSNGGSNRPSNLITLCPTCHSNVHTGKAVCPKPASNNKFRDAGVLNSCMKAIYNKLADLCPTQWTYGYITKSVRQLYNIEKSHSNDATIIAICDESGIQDIPADNYFNHKLTVNFKQYRRHVRTFTMRHEDRKYYIDVKHVDKNGNERIKKKPFAWNRNQREGQTKNHRSLIDLKRYLRERNVGLPNLLVKLGRRVSRRLNADMKFRPGDIVKYKGKYYVCEGWASTQGKVILEHIGYVKQKLCQKILNNSGMVAIPA